VSGPNICVLLYNYKRETTHNVSALKTENIYYYSSGSSMNNIARYNMQVRGNTPQNN
jgi:hypothetical protein